MKGDRGGAGGTHAVVAARVVAAAWRCASFALTAAAVADSGAEASLASPSELLVPPSEL